MSDPTKPAQTSLALARMALALLDRAELGAQVPARAVTAR